MQSAAPAVVVPERAVQVSGDTGTVFVVQDDTLERRAVRVGGTHGRGPHRVVGNIVGDAPRRRRFFAAGERHARADESKA